jgi:hypothetical protein
MVFVLLNNLEISKGSVESLAAGGQLRNAHEHAALVKISALFSEADLHRWASANAVSIPIGDSVPRRTSRRATVNATTQILRITGIASVLAATDEK